MPTSKKSTKKPPMTQAEKNGGRYAAEVAAAKRDGWEGRSAALTAWQKGEAVMVRKDVLEGLIRGEKGGGYDKS